MADADRFTIGVFQDTAWAARGVAALLADGFTAASLSIIAPASPEAEALISSTFGAAGIRLELHGIGPVYAHGPVVHVLQGADAGLATAGIRATIRRAGFQPHDGLIFEQLTGRGGVLVGIRSEPRTADALARLHAYGGGNAAIGAWTGRL